MKINGSVVVITGAASGIGEAAARYLSAAGAKVVLGDMNAERLPLITGEITAAKGEAASRVVDVTKEEDVRSFMNYAKDQFGQINIVLACAGIIRDSFFVTTDRETGKVKKFMSTEQWKQVIDVNLTGVFLTLREAVIQMVDNNWPGILIPISSINKEGELGQLNYSSTKAAIALWPKILAGEFHARKITNIRIAAVAPGYVATPILTSMKPDILQSIINDIPIGRLIETDEVISTIKFIIENEAVHATTIEVAGGIIGKGLAK